jgi:hypothetical protein
VTQGQEHRAAMATLDKIQESMTSTEIEKDEEQKEYIQSLQKLKTSLDKKTRFTAKNQQLMEETMEMSQTLMEKMETSKTLS